MVARDLDKITKGPLRAVKNRQDALTFADEIPQDSFRIGLLASFVYEHQGHDCVMFNDTAVFPKEIEQLNPFFGKTKEDGNFWKENK